MLVFGIYRHLGMLRCITLTLRSRGLLTTCSLDGQTGHYQPYGKDWIKKGIYELLHKVRMTSNSHKLYRSTRAVVRLRAQHLQCSCECTLLCSKREPDEHYRRRLKASMAIDGKHARVVSKGAS